MIKQKEVVKDVNIKPRLLRFWIKEYSLEDYYISKKTGNQYKKNIIPILRLIKLLKEKDLFTTKSIKQIIYNIKKNNLMPQNMQFFKDLQNDILDIFSKNKPKKEDYNDIIDSKEEYYFDLLKKSERLLNKENFFDAINLLTLVKNNSTTYNLIATEMIEIAKSYRKEEKK